MERGSFASIPRVIPQVPFPFILTGKVKRVLFGQDLHGPLLEEFGSNLDDWDRSTKKLLDLNADILCEGHFGIYKTKKEVKDYILSYRRQYGVEK